VNRVPVRVENGPPPPGWVALRTRACPCCTGRVELQVALARLIRTQRPQGVLIGLPDAAHRPALLRALAERPLAQYVQLEEPA
jgi:hypothetical protein